MTAVIRKPEDIASYYHRLLATTTLHMYMGKALEEPVFHMTVPIPGTHDPQQTLAKDYPKQIADAIIDNKDYRPPLEEALHEFEASPHQYIDRHMDDPLLSEREIAESIGISASYLSALFRRQRQITVTKYIRDLRLKKSLELLQETGLPIHEICRMCGFGSVETFHRVFKAEYAISPREAAEAPRRPAAGKRIKQNDPGEGMPKRPLRRDLSMLLFAYFTWITISPS